MEEQAPFWAPKGGTPKGVAPKGVAPKGVAPKGGPNLEKVGPRRVGARRVGGPKFRAFFPSPATISLILSFSGGLLVEFWWCLKRRSA